VIPVSFLSFLSSATAAATPAAASFSDPVDLVNTDTGYPPSERYPGAVDPSQYSAGSGPQPPGGTGGPVAAGYGPDPFTSTLPHQAPGGGWQDTAWMTGHDGPQAVWDSSAGQAFAPSGAVGPDLHGEDTGGVWIREHVIPASIGSLTRRVQAGQTTVRNGSGDQVTKDNITSPNGRTDLDQYQMHDPDGFDPWDIPYGERPVQNNLAYEAMPIEPTGSPYTPAGELSDRSVYDYAAQAYESPPDPYVGTAAAPANSGGIGGGWLAG
jgi:hypothetical protein